MRLGRYSDVLGGLATMILDRRDMPLPSVAGGLLEDSLVLVGAGYAVDAANGTRGD